MSYKNLLFKLFENHGDIIDTKSTEEIVRFVSNDRIREEEKIEFLKRRASFYYEMKREKAEAMFDDMLDSTYSDVVIGGISYPYSFVYQRVDKVAYEIEKNEFIQYELEDIEEL